MGDEGRAEQQQGQQPQDCTPDYRRVFTSHKLAKKHGVKLATIHKWNSLGYTALEMIAGKQDPDLASVSLALPAPPPKVIKRRQLRHLPPPTPNEDAD
jgi:hypothetical protein